MNVLIVSDDAHLLWKPSSDDYDTVLVKGEEFLWRGYDSYFNSGYPEVIMISLDLVMPDGIGSPIKKKGPFGAIVALRCIKDEFKYVGILHSGSSDDNASAKVIGSFGSSSDYIGTGHRQEIGSNQFFAIGSGGNFMKGIHKNWLKLLEILLHNDCQHVECVKCKKNSEKN